MNQRFIIINANSDKQKLFKFWDFKEILMISFWALVGYGIGHFFSDIASVLLALLFGGIMAALYIEIKNRLTILEVIKRLINYYFHTPKDYYHKPKPSNSIIYNPKVKER